MSGCPPSMGPFSTNVLLAEKQWGFLADDERAILGLAPNYMFENECCNGTDVSTHLIDSMSVMHALLKVSKYHFAAQNQERSRVEGLKVGEFLPLTSELYHRADSSYHALTTWKHSSSFHGILLQAKSRAKWKRCETIQFGWATWLSVSQVLQSQDICIKFYEDIIGP